MPTSLSPDTAVSELKYLVRYAVQGLAICAAGFEELRDKELVASERETLDAASESVKSGIANILMRLEEI